MAQGEALARQGKALAAAENFEMADRLGGAGVSCLINLGDIYANHELPGLAVEAYKRAMAKDTRGNPSRIIRAARFLCAGGALAEAAQLAETIESNYGDRMKAEARKDLLRLRARMALATGAGAEEAAILTKIVELDPLDGDALILLGRHAGRIGKVEKAIFYFERAAGIEGFEADAKVRQAQLLVREGRCKEALPLLKRAQEIKPRNNVQKYYDQVKRVAGR